jgi:hypothetical protein
MDRFWSKVNKDAANGCWEWTASKNKKGYGDPSILNTRQYNTVDNISYFLDYDVYLHNKLLAKKKEVSEGLMSLINKTPRKVVDKVVKEVNEVREINKDAVNSLLNRKINAPTISTPQPRVPQPANNNRSSNKDTLQKLFMRKTHNKSDSPYINIGGKLNR